MGWTRYQAHGAQAICGGGMWLIRANSPVTASAAPDVWVWRPAGAQNEIKKGHKHNFVLRLFDLPHICPPIKKCTCEAAYPIV
jgi:hypothetical protein